MGCDIHMTVEMQDHLGYWHGIQSIEWIEAYDSGFTIPKALKRNYSRFGALAGVRHDGPDPRGLPEDISFMTTHRLGQPYGPYHSHSWLPLREAAAIFKATDHRPYDTDESPEVHYFGLDPEDAEHCRLVFWFDN